MGRRHRFVVAGAALYGLDTALIPLAAYFDGAVAPLRVAAFGRTYRLGGAFFALFGAYGILGVADSVRLPASMALFVGEGEEHDAVASNMSLRSLSWKVGQVAGPLAIGGIKKFVSPEVAFLAAADFVAFATTVFAVTTTRLGEAGDATPMASD